MFVLLQHHRAPQVCVTSAARGVDVHWDFLIEVPDQERLITWRLSVNPVDEPGPITAERIADHRINFLDFEGLLSGNQGRVFRVDRGEALVLHWDGPELRAELRGACLWGVFEIISSGPDGHIFRRVKGFPEQA